ncbi:MAG: hypothetical protein LIO71_04295 [Ruminococcus sp.]|nr:hypothetical protein [Ruminococcus sp.]
MNRDNNRKKINIRTILIMVVVFLIGFDSGTVCTVLLEQNDVFAFKSISEDDSEYSNIYSSETITEIENATTNQTTTTTEITTIEPPTPVRNMYPDMTVEKVPFKEDVEGDKVVYITFDDGPWEGTS